MPESVIQVLLHAYSVSGVGNGCAGREGEGSVRHEACILVFFLHLSIT